MTGASNGCVRIHSLSSPHSLTSLEAYWSLAMHDSQGGSVSCLAVSHDDRYVLTGGSDGNVFVYQANLPSTAAGGVAEVPRPHPGTVSDIVVSSARVWNNNLQNSLTHTHTQTQAPTALGKDIEDPTHYSIEDAKQKAEHDRRMKLAEEKKHHMRREVTALRKVFRRLKQRNSALPRDLRLGEREFVMDPHLEAELRSKAEEKVAEVRRQMAWESEKHSIALSKLQQRSEVTYRLYHVARKEVDEMKWVWFSDAKWVWLGSLVSLCRYKDVVECERVTVWSMGGEHHVSSFRAAAPSRRYLELVEQCLSCELTQTPWTAAGKKPPKALTVGEEGGGEAVRGDGGEGEGVVEGEKGGEGSEPPPALSKTEARRLRRERRKREVRGQMACPVHVYVS